MTDPEILFIVNSVFGARKAPGYRPWQPVRFGLLHPRVVARGGAVTHAPMHFPLPGRSLIPRGLNFLRIKLFPWLPAREIEQGLFDRLCLTWSRLRHAAPPPRAVHLWDHLPLTAQYWKSRGVPLLLDLHMAHPRCYQPLVAQGRVDAATLGSLEDPAADLCIELADILVCPSAFVRETLPLEAQSRAVVIPFGADPVAGATDPAPGAATSPARPVRVLFAGNVNQRKGVPFLLEAWRRLALPPEQAELVLCGRQFSEAAPWLRDAPPGITLAGFQPDMAPWFRDADLFVLPSLMEGSAKAVYEAMAHGLPAIVTPHTGSVIRDGVDGLVVPPAEPAPLAAALERLIRDTPLRQTMGAAARAAAAAYTWEAYARGVAGLYDALPAPRPAFAHTLRDHNRLRPTAWTVRQGTARLSERGRGRWLAGPLPSGPWLRFPFYHHVFLDERRGFAAQLDAMRQWGEFLSLDDAVALLEAGGPRDGRYFCLTFDDGFRNNLTVAAPLLAERNIPATVFLVSGLVAEHPDDCTEAHRRFFGPQRRPAPFLTWNDCRALAAAGITVGSHSRSHLPFAKMDDATAAAEIRGSREDLEKRLGEPVAHFCCPWGKPGRDFVRDRDPALARAAGYRSFLTTEWGAMHPGDSPFHIRRFGVLAGEGATPLPYLLNRGVA